MKAKRLASLMGIALAGRFDYFAYNLWVRAKKLNFSPVSLEELGLTEERSVHHSASGGAYLTSVLKTIDIPPGSRALDLGSGKGAAACTMGRFNFDEVLGVELTHKLVGIAEKNVKQVGLKNVHFLCTDAGQFTDLDRFTHLYMFNPFPANVVAEVMKNLRDSLCRKERRLILIYYFPFCHKTVMESKIFPEPRLMKFPCSHPWFVYDNKLAAMAKTAKLRQQ